MSEVYEVRCSLIWTELFNDIVPQGAPLGFLGSRAGYEERFRALRDLEPTDGDFPTLPWNKKNSSNFWKYYLETTNLAQVSEAKARRGIIPLYYQIPIYVDEQMPLLKRWVVEGFVYPHGSSTIISFTVLSSASLEALVEETVNIRLKKHKVTSFRKKTDLLIEQIASLALDHLRLQCFGDERLMSWRSQEPFIISTVITGNVSPLATLSENNNIHKALEGLASLHQLWKTKELHLLKSAALEPDKKEVPHNGIVYSLKQGRALWFPQHFQASSGRRLSNYHRNMTLGTMHINALLVLMRLYMTTYRERQPPPYISDLARFGAGALGRLFWGQNTYRSLSFKSQIQDPQVFPNLNAVRKRSNLPALESIPSPKMG